MDSSIDVNAKGKIRSTELEEDGISADEQRPLLPRPSQTHRSGHERTHSSITIPHIPTVHDPRTILYILFVQISIVGLGFAMVMIPTTRVIEDVICHQYYGAMSGQGHIGLWEQIDEGLCKEDAIQEKLAFVKGISDMLESVPSKVERFLFWG